MNAALAAPAEFVILDLAEIEEQFGIWEVEGRLYRLADLIPDMHATVDFLYQSLNNINNPENARYQIDQHVEEPEDEDDDELERLALGELDPYVMSCLTRQALYRLSEILYGHFLRQGMYGRDGYLMYELQSDLGVYSPVFRLVWDRDQPIHRQPRGLTTFKEPSFSRL